MAINNTVILTGNMGAEAEIIETENTTFASLSLATTDTYKDEESGDWMDQATIWHNNVISFNPKIIQALKGLKKGSRIKIEGSLSYRPYRVSKVDENGEVKEFDLPVGSVVVRKIELAPLVKKSK